MRRRWGLLPRRDLLLELLEPGVARLHLALKLVDGRSILAKFALNLDLILQERLSLLLPHEQFRHADASIEGEASRRKAEWAEAGAPVAVAARPRSTCCATSPSTRRSG